MKYDVELFSHEKHWTVTNENGREFFVHEHYNANTDYTDVEVSDDGGHKIGGQLLTEIIEAVEKRNDL